MTKELIELDQPEQGEEHGLLWFAAHGCKEADALRSIDREIDMMLFPVGLVGYTMPQGVMFAVPSSEPCAACGKYDTRYFVWRKRLIIV